jgi:GNAT superfamily N-acetyltransferase
VIRDVFARDLPHIRELLARANDTPYDLDRVAEEKCFGDGFEGKARARIFGDFEGIAVTCGKYLRILAVDRVRRGRGIGTALLRDAESRGTTVIGAEPGNYFTPGVMESHADFFRTRGYEQTGRTQNLVADTAAADGSAESPSQARRGSFAVFAAQDDTARERVLHFIEKNFGPIWRFEARRGATILFVEHGGEIAGFSTHEANNRGLGVFGPTGVLPSARGHGFGRALLLASLADLRRLGYHRAVIPWTDAIEFYEKSCGAQITDRFVILRRRSA